MTLEFSKDLKELIHDQAYHAYYHEFMSPMFDIVKTQLTPQQLQDLTSDNKWVQSYAPEHHNNVINRLNLRLVKTFNSNF